MRVRRRIQESVVGALLCIAFAATPGLAQTMRARSPVIPPRTVPTAALGREDFAFVASLAVPGTGQYVLKQDRWLPYAALETWAWIRYLERRSSSRRLSRDFKDFAWSTARRISVGVRRDTTFPYYETLLHYRASGAFDAQPSQEGLQPEVDVTTYNGEQWELARQLFLPTGNEDQQSAEYQAALAYYRSHAITDAYAFAWNRGTLEQQAYGNVISDSDAAYRDATRMLGLILANHLTSAVDALISARLRSAVPSLRFESGLSPDARRAPSSPGSAAGPLRFDAQLRYTW